MNGSIVLAAGESRRMGVPKMLLPFGGATVIRRVVDELFRSMIDRTLVVVGHESATITEALRRSSATIVENPDYPSGMLSSVRCGIRALPPECEVVLVVPGDQASIRSELVDELLAAFAEQDKGIAVPVYQGKRGHPLTLSMRYRDEILTHFDDVGLRGILRAHPDDVLEVETNSPAALSDIDSPEDYRRELAALD
jgi:molybdenum cofactor cytidylyltransferase